MGWTLLDLKLISVPNHSACIQMQIQIHQVSLFAKAAGKFRAKFCAPLQCRLPEQHFPSLECLTPNLSTSFYASDTGSLKVRDCIVLSRGGSYGTHNKGKKSTRRRQHASSEVPLHRKPLQPPRSEFTWARAPPSLPFQSTPSS